MSYTYFVKGSRVVGDAPPTRGECAQFGHDWRATSGFRQEDTCSRCGMVRQARK